jgi:hypothetical protein
LYSYSTLSVVTKPVLLNLASVVTKASITGPHPFPLQQSQYYLSTPIPVMAKSNNMPPWQLSSLLAQKADKLIKF